jgi:hypothetical protein
MKKEELENYIYTKLIKDGKLIASAVQWGLVDKIENDLNEYVRISNSSVEKLFRYLNNDDKNHSCYCGNKVEFLGFKKGFRKYCSKKCMANSKDVINKRSSTYIKKYGGFPFDDSSVLKDKTLKTNLEKYGVEYPNQNESIKLKQRKTMIQRYGVEHNTGIQEIFLKQQKKQKTNFAPKKYKTIFGNEVYYQSRPELDFVKVCEKFNKMIENGPTLKYVLNEKTHYYHVDFETDDFLVEIKSNHHYYKEALESGEIDAKNTAANRYAKNHNKRFIFLLDKNKKNIII